MKEAHGCKQSKRQIYEIAHLRRFDFAVPLFDVVLRFAGLLSPGFPIFVFD